MDCIFCAIAARQIPATIVYEDETFVVFPDLHPQARVHWLIVPKQHVSDVLACAEMDPSGALLSKLAAALPEIVARAGLAENGFRLVTNCGVHGGQTVPHLHFHLLGGEMLEAGFGR